MDNQGMVNRKRDKDYIRKVIRISQKYIVLCDFLDFYAGYKEINKFEFYNNLFNYSLSKISGDLGYKFKKPAASVFERMLWLNPPDNQGVRFIIYHVKDKKPWRKDY